MIKEDELVKMAKKTMGKPKPKEPELEKVDAPAANGDAPMDKPAEANGEAPTEAASAANGDAPKEGEHKMEVDAEGDGSASGAGADGEAAAEK